MNKKSLIVALATFALVSCGNNKMPTIDKTTAISRADEIKARQDDSSFVLPDNFIIKTDSTTKSEGANKDGKWKSTGTEYIVEEYDFQNMQKREYESTNTSYGSTEIETFYYYSKDEKLQYTLTNANGYKTYTTVSMSEEDAKNACAEMQKEAGDKIKWRETQDPDINEEAPELYLDHYKKISDYYENLHQQYLDDKDSYCNISYGSSGPKDLQTIIELEIKDEDEDNVLTQTEKKNITLKNDLLFSRSEKSIVYTQEKKHSFYYTKEENDTNTSISYGNASIKIPDLKDYEKIEEPMSYGL